MSDELPPDVADAIARCKEYQASRPGVPVAFYIVTSDEHVICMPPTIEANDRLSRMINNNQGKQDVLRWVETFCAEHIFWVRGQTGEGPKAAMEQLKKVRNGGDIVKADLFGDICSQVQTLLEQHKTDLAKDRPTAKVLDDAEADLGESARLFLASRGIAATEDAFLGAILEIRHRRRLEDLLEALLKRPIV